MDLINDIQLLSTSSELCYCYFQSLPVFVVSSGQFRYVVSPGKKWTLLQYQRTNYVCFDAYKAKCMHTAIHDF